MQTNHSTPLELPMPIANFFAHETSDPQAVARCFSEDAVVIDEGHEQRGQAAIAAWNATVVRKFSFTTEPLTAETVAARTTVSAKVSGNFPGSPVTLRFHFTVAGDLISLLEIAS